MSISETSHRQQLTDSFQAVAFIVRSHDWFFLADAEPDEPIDH
jgi:hypothetical protein